MKTRLLIIIGMIVFPLVIPQGFSQCIYNEDWPDAPCFDMGPVSHLEYYKGWAPYYDFKGAEWMEIKKIEMDQHLENKTIEKWVDEKLENYNVYRYYLSTNEIQSQLPYDTLFVILDLNFIFEPTEREPTEEELENALILCVSGYTQVGPQCVPNNELEMSAYEIFFIVLLVIISIVLIYYIKRKRKRHEN